jgi:hypothetical protein
VSVFSQRSCNNTAISAAPYKSYVHDT